MHTTDMGFEQKLRSLAKHANMGITSMVSMPCKHFQVLLNSMLADVHAVAGLPQLTNMHADMGITLMVSLPCEQPQLLLKACTALQTCNLLVSSFGNLLQGDSPLQSNCTPFANLLSVDLLLLTAEASDGVQHYFSSHPILSADTGSGRAP